ncbi:hypothetical protein BC834DRAFT_861936 [Gloeopeniophorella convolvens]|nr:hypothetical protein BC834DRAFT_861936 [Gloeopeniophorella convolvens]
MIDEFRDKLQLSDAPKQVPWSRDSDDSHSPPVTPFGPPDDPTLILLSKPIIHNPGNGPRVRDMRAFIDSSFAQPAWSDDPLCAEFAQREVLQMLRTVLPEETALVRRLWYNKSRRVGRVCPACLRLYTLADAPPDISERLLSEQVISGLCSPLCFMLASYGAPGAAKVAWGRMAEDLDDATWDLLDGPVQHAQAQGRADVGLGMLLKMTRLHDLGLAQLCVPDMVVDEEIYDDRRIGDGISDKRESCTAGMAAPMQAPRSILQQTCF